MSAARFVVPAALEATRPAEDRGLPRDQVRLLVSRGGEITHATFAELPRFLDRGDLLVVNTSATLPAAVDGHSELGPVTLHFATALEERAPGAALWAVEVRSSAIGTGPLPDAVAGMRIELPDSASATLLEHWPVSVSRLWRARISLRHGGVVDLLRTHGRPIAYAYVRDRWPLTDYQTVFATTPGSAEMPSAGRPFTDRLVTELVSAGVGLAPILLHTGVSSPEGGEPPLPERFSISATTARVVNETRAASGRVVAVGTTVTRALESAATGAGVVSAAAGWTNLVLGPDRPARVVDGLITGWHAPGASHLRLLEAVVGTTAVRAAYDAALERGYLWHEFGDSALLLR